MSTKRSHILKQTCSFQLKAFIQSQLVYCSLTWMFHRRGFNNKINQQSRRVASHHNLEQSRRVASRYNLENWLIKGTL